MNFTDLKSQLEVVTPEHIWLFNSGDNFCGNVKYLFLYINKLRTDIRAYYLCNNKQLADKITALGYQAYTFDSREGLYLMSRGGVYVNEQCQDNYLEPLRQLKLLNLGNGVGLKKIERRIDVNDANLSTIKKYIEYNSFFRNNMCCLVTSPMMERHFKEQLGLKDTQIIRGGYPRNLYSRYIKDTPTNWKKNLNIPPVNKVILYAPTYRYTTNPNSLNKILLDFPRLNQILNEKSITLIIKLHNYEDILAQQIKIHKHLNNIILWDNNNDIYEAFPIIDAAIIDYLSIFYDLIFAGITKYIRYIFDYETEKNQLVDDYFTYTTGRICNTFEELLVAIEEIDFYADDENIDKIKKDFWEYSTDDSLDRIIEQTQNFSITHDTSPDLYSFDIFDTLVHRRCGIPSAIFLEVQEKLPECTIAFPKTFYQSYVQIRIEAELAQKTYYRNFLNQHEINFDSIFEMIRWTYDLNHEQIELLKRLELETELANIYPDRIIGDRITKLLDAHEQVILISDMYLPLDFIKQLVQKCFPDFKDIPIFLSSEYKVRKHSRQLYYEVYKHYNEKYWGFDNWYHTGDNRQVDYDQARKMGIHAEWYNYRSQTQFEIDLTDSIKSSDAAKVAEIFRAYRNNNGYEEKSYFSLAILAPLFVGYASWIIEHALAHGYECLYFVTRDCILLKSIADHIISTRHIKLKTKLFYCSRMSMGTTPQALSTENYDHFYHFLDGKGALQSIDNLLIALSCTAEDLHNTIPNISLTELLDKSQWGYIVQSLKASPKFKSLVLEKLTAKHFNFVAYLKQEINFNERFAFVDLLGGGTSKDFMTKVFEQISPDINNTWYYMFCSRPTIGKNVRFCFFSLPINSKATADSFEAITTNTCGISTTMGYKHTNDGVMPVYVKQYCNVGLKDNIIKMSRIYFEEFTRLQLTQPVAVLRQIAHFSYTWFRNNSNNPLIWRNFVHFKMAVQPFTPAFEFAPVLTKATCLEILRFQLHNRQVPRRLTWNLPMSLARSSKAVRDFYTLYSKDNFKLARQVLSAQQTTFDAHPDVEPAVATARNNQILLTLYYGHILSKCKYNLPTPVFTESYIQFPLCNNHLIHYEVSFYVTGVLLAVHFERNFYKYSSCMSELLKQKLPLKLTDNRSSSIGEVFVFVDGRENVDTIAATTCSFIEETLPFLKAQLPKLTKEHYLNDIYTIKSEVASFEHLQAENQRLSQSQSELTNQLENLEAAFRPYRKVRKLIKHPYLYFRDMFIKKT